jgi:signal transduction histidine kinase
VFKASRGIEDIYELTYIRKDRSRFPAVVSVTALRDAQDAIIGYLLIGTDNTTRKRAEAALLQAGALQRAIFNSANFSSIATDAKGVIQIFNVGAERMLGYSAAEVVNTITPAVLSDPQELIARATALSLEFATPIAPGFEALVFKASRGIEDIYVTDASEEMGQLIDDLLAFSRVGRAEIRNTSVQLDELVQDVIRSLEMVTKGRSIVWQIASLPPVVGDAPLLKQVLSNLIDNAVKYSRLRDPATIEIGCSDEEAGRVVLFVRDNGVGFDMQYAHKLFGVFQRLHRPEEFEGTGIGLATVRRIVARHGGRVWTQGAINEGATFYFTLERSPSA